MTGDKLHAVLEDLGFLVRPDANTNRGFFVRWPDGSPLGFYQLAPDGAYRTGWVESKYSTGRIDCPDWPTFYDRITKATRP